METLTNKKPTGAYQSVDLTVNQYPNFRSGHRNSLTEIPNLLVIESASAALSQSSNNPKKGRPPLFRKNASIVWAA